MQAQRASQCGKGIQELGDGALAGDEVGMEELAPQQASPAVKQPIELFWIAAGKLRQPGGPQRQSQNHHHPEDDPNPAVQRPQAQPGPGLSWNDMGCQDRLLLGHQG